MSSGTLHTKGPVNVDSLLTTTREVFLKTKDFLNDAVFNKVTLLNHLNKNERIMFQGGASILVGLLFGKNTTFKAYSGDDIIDTTGFEGITTAQFAWRSMAGTIKYDGDEIRQNAGGKLFDLARAKTIQATMSARDSLASDLQASTQGAKTVSALPILVDNTSIVADINSTTNSFWQAQVTTSVGAFATGGIPKMRDMRNKIINAGQNGGTAPDLWLTTQLITELYEASQQTQLRYGVGDTQDAGAASPLFAGAPVSFDANTATGEMYALPSDSLQFVVHSDANWDIGEFQSPPQQDVWIAKVIWMGNLVTNNRRRLGKLTGITA